MDLIKFWDAAILKAINGLHSPFFDYFMWLVSDKFIWFPLYALLIYLAYRKIRDNKKFLVFLLIGFATVGTADFTATYGLKKQIKRYRPSHHLELSQHLRFHQFEDETYYKGGQYGFVSGHATNSFAIAVFFGLFFLQFGNKRLLAFMILWAVLVAYSRMYLGVHYPSDLIGGTILGGSFAFVGHRIYRRLSS